MSSAFMPSPLAPPRSLSAMAKSQCLSADGNSPSSLETVWKQVPLGHNQKKVGESYKIRCQFQEQKMSDGLISLGSKVRHDEKVKHEDAASTAFLLKRRATLPGCKTYSVLPRRKTLFRKKPQKTRRSTCFHGSSQHFTGRRRYLSA